MDGWEFLEEFQILPESYLKTCKIYMLTSSIDPSDIEKSAKYKIIQDFISKPLTSEKLETLSLSAPHSSRRKYQS
jgi:CheY-like chemotaxis protein